MSENYKHQSRKSHAQRERMKVQELLTKYQVKDEFQLSTSEQKAELKTIRDWGNKRRAAAAAAKRALKKRKMTDTKDDKTA